MLQQLLRRARGLLSAVLVWSVEFMQLKARRLSRWSGGCGRLCRDRDCNPEHSSPPDRAEVEAPGTSCTRRRFATTSKPCDNSSAAMADDALIPVNEEGVNFVEQIEPDLALYLLSFLDDKSLARCSAVCSQWSALASDDDAWRWRCEALWEGKIHVCEEALKPETPRLKAYGLALADSRRTEITMEDLTRCAWQFRFKITAGDYWMILDPSHRGLPPLERHFHPDGTLTGSPGDNSDRAFGVSQWHWKFAASKEGRKGTFVRVNSYPSLEASRRADWGWHLENCWVIHSSTAKPRIPAPPPEAAV